MENNTQFFLNTEGISLLKSGQPVVRISASSNGQPGELIYRGEWRIMKSLLMQIINPFSEGILTFSFRDAQNVELYSGSFRSYHKKIRKLVKLDGLEGYDVVFKSKWLQNIGCELLAADKASLLLWKPEQAGKAMIYRSNELVASITQVNNGRLMHYRQIEVLAPTDVELLLAFITVVYSY